MLPCFPEQIHHELSIQYHRFRKKYPREWFYLAAERYRSPKAAQYTLTMGGVNYTKRYNALQVYVS